MLIFGSLREIISAVFRKDGKEVSLTVGTQSGTATNRAFQLPAVNSNTDFTKTIVDTDSQQTLSTKTLDDTSLLDTARLKNAQVRMQGTAGGVSSLDFYEDGTIGTNKVSIKAPASLGADYSITLPSDGGNSNASVLATTSGDGVTSWIRYASTNTNSTLVQRDVSGNFAANTVTLAGNIGVNGGDLTTTAATFNLVNATATTVNLAGAATTFNAAGTTAAATVNVGSGATISGATKTVNIGTAGVSGSTTNVNIGPTAGGGTVTVNKNTTFNTTGAITLPSGTAAQQPGQSGQPAAANGMIRYNTDTNSFEGYASGAWSGIGGGGTTDKFTQASPSLAVGDVVYLNGSVYTKAIATSAAAAEVVGVISRGPAELGANNYELTLSGEVSGFTGLTTGDVYFLSAATAGGLTATEPSVIGQVSVPVGVASSASTLYVAPKRGAIVGGTNARTEISLANTTSAQTIYTAPSGLVAGELAGWVYIDAATDYRFYLAAQFAQNGANSNWNLSYQTSGDTPPTGFSVSITSGGAIQVTMNPVPTSFVSGSVNYSINGPAVGATFPLEISARKVLGDTSGVAVPAGYIGEIQSATKTSTTIGSTTRASYTTLVTLSNLPAGVWKLEATLPYYSITGASGDSGGVSYGATFSARIYNSTDAAIVISTSANTARSVTNSGYVAGGNVTLLATVNISTAKTYVFDFAFESNSGVNTETITAIQVGAASIAPVVLRAIRIA